VTLVAGGLLGLLPLHAAPYLVDSEERCFLDEFDVAYAPAARVASAARSALVTRQRAGTVIAGVGNPLPNPSSLPFAALELAEVGAFFPAAARYLLREEAATKAALAPLLPRAAYLHLACHGLFNADDPLASHLQLSGTDALTLGELLAGDGLPATRLVVLSACQTAITEFRHLPDETIGLPAGFLQAGAAAVIGTLWSVADLSTTVLMRKFYELHRNDGLVPTTALRQAQQWLRRATADQLGLAPLWQRRFDASGGRDAQAYHWFRYYRARPDDVPFAHPYHWAGFVYAGAVP
jgi:CHAT domain-containing protein